MVMQADDDNDCEENDDDDCVEDDDCNLSLFTQIWY